MKLLTSQKNQLYQLIEDWHLSPVHFDINELTSLMSEIVLTRVIYKNTDYYFDFLRNHRLEENCYIRFCPGGSYYLEERYAETWDKKLHGFVDWLENLKREINEPDKWERLKTEMSGLDINYDFDDEKFSFEEHENLKIKMSLLKEKITGVDLLPEQIEVINNKLDHLTEMAERMSKFDWKSLFIGTMMSVIIQLEVNHTNAQTLWMLIKNIFKGYFLT